MKLSNEKLYASFQVLEAMVLDNFNARVKDASTASQRNGKLHVTLKTGPLVHIAEEDLRPGDELAILGGYAPLFSYKGDDKDAVEAFKDILIDAGINSKVTNKKDGSFVLRVVFRAKGDAARLEKAVTAYTAAQLSGAVEAAVGRLQRECKLSAATARTAISAITPR